MQKDTEENTAPETLSLRRRRWLAFKANKRGMWSLWLFLFLYGISLCSNVLVNDRPLFVAYKGAWFFPIFKDYPEVQFGGFLARTDFRDPFIQETIAKGQGMILWPPVRYSYQTVNENLPTPAPSPPTWLLSKAQACHGYPQGEKDVGCTFGNWNWLGTDDQGRDVLARTLYGLRLSITFGFLLTFFASCIGVAAGAVQGYFGGLLDLFFQRGIEIWNSVPTLYLLIILSAFFVPNFWLLLSILVLFSWTDLVGVVRAEFLRARNFEYVRAAQALGAPPLLVMWRHVLPNAMVATLTFLPFIASGSIATLTSLDFLGFGLPPGSPSLGELLSQGQNNPQAPWLALIGFIISALLLSFLVFIGEAGRDAFDPRKTLA